MKVLIVLCLVAGAFASCPANSHYEGCGTACPVTCDNYQDPPIFCVLMCNPGCHCDEGYVKTEDGNCVKPEQCPKASLVGSTCLGEAETGFCRGYLPMWYYDVQSGTCKQFIYGGCGGNGNRYVTEKQCMEKCSALSPKQSSSNALCELPAETGMCRGYFPRFHFDSASGECKEFIYGGCQGNANNFGTIEECHNTCGNSKASATCGVNEQYTTCGTSCPLTCGNFQNPPRICNLMCNIGCECVEGYVRSADGRCIKPENCPARNVKPHDYHITQALTLKQSSSNALCELPAETGMCRGFFPRFHFDSASGECKEFIYGGCQGNLNNFGTIEECHDKCGNSKASATCGVNEQYTTCGTSCPLTCDNFQNPPRICNLMCNIGCECVEGYVRSADGRCVKPENCPARALDRPDCDKAPETGLCDAYFPRFYYDQEAGMCKRFVYGGCGGNRNNFATELECYNKCGALASSLKAACQQEKVVGPCRARVPRYFYNKQSGQCELFVYGGCHGNDNNFATKNECEDTCFA